MGRPKLRVQGADKSQLAGVEFRAFDRIAFASRPPRNRTAHVPSGEEPGQYCIRCRAVRSLQSGSSGNNREIRALFAPFGAKPAEVVCSPDCVAEREGFGPTARIDNT